MNVGLAVRRIAQRAPQSLALFDGERTLSYGVLDWRIIVGGNAPMHFHKSNPSPGGNP